MTEELNTGSRARDHLANERTFLAWIRTGLGGVALGIAVERFQAAGTDDQDDLFLPALLIGLSIVLLVGASLRYFSVAAELDRGRFQVSRAGPVALVVGAVVVAVVSLLLMVV